MKKSCLILLTFLSCIMNSVQAQWTFLKSKEKVSIPFEIVNNTIILKARVNDTNLNLILDTGSNLNILFSFPEKDSIIFENTSKINITGPGIKKPVSAILSKKNKLDLGTVKTYLFDVIIVDQNDFQLANNMGIPIHGILGTNLFLNFIIEINYQKKMLIFFDSKSKRISKIKKKYKELSLDIIENKPYLETQICLDSSSTKNVKLLLDTGLSDGLWIIENTFLTQNKKSINDYLGTGLGGAIFGKKIRFSALKLADFKLNAPIISFPDSTTFFEKNYIKDRSGSLGGEILKKFNLIFDFNSKKLYIKPNSHFSETFHYNSSGIHLQHVGYEILEEKIKLESGIQAINLNEYVLSDVTHKFNFVLKPTFEIAYIRNHSVAEQAGLKIGDKLLRVNNKSALLFSLSQLNELLSNNNQEIIIEIERNKEKKTVKLVLKDEI